jgi:type II secretory pathway pseudopilin PulG
VLFIISAVAALAVPAYKRIHLSARSAAAINDLRVFASAFQSYAHARGDWPPATGVPGEVPAGMETYLATTNWTHPSPIGGAYTWAANSVQQGDRFRAVLIISTVGENKVSADRNLLADIDQRIDDGNLETGNFRLGFRNQPVFVIEH